MSQTKQSAGRRLSVITIDQAIAGASNVLIAVLAARLLDVASFGLFGILFLIYMMVIGVSRALVSDPLLVHPVEAQERPNEAIGTGMVLGLGLGAVVLVGGLIVRLWSAELGDALVVLAVCVPLLVLQDLGRYLGFATQRPWSAVALDTCWLMLLIACVPVLVAADARTLTWFIAAWGGTGAITGLLTFWMYRDHRVRMTLSWLRHTWTFSWRYLISYTSTQSSALAASSGIGAIAGASALGGVQGASLLVRPFATFQVAAVAAGVSEISRSGSVGSPVRRMGVKTSALTTGIAALNVLVMLALPDSVGHMILGDTWTTAQPLLLPTGAQILCLGMITGARAGLLGMRAVRPAMAIDVCGTVLFVVAALGGAVIGGALGALWAVALVQAMIMVTWWIVFSRHTRGSESDRDSASVGQTSLQVAGPPTA